MSHNDTKSLNVVIGGINIPVRLQESERAHIEEITAEVNARLKDIQLRYPDKKLEESLAMTLLSLMVKKRSEKQIIPDQEEILEEFDRMDTLLDRLLQ